MLENMTKYIRKHIKEQKRPILPAWFIKFY